MKTLNLIQGSTEWKAHRATAYNASDAPAMLGISKYKTRSDLIKERATGITPDVNDSTQRLFNDGHRFEALARPLAETIIGEELSPITGVDGKYSASFDGITFDGDVIFEHKTANDEIRMALSGTHIANVLSEHYCAQMEHQLMVSGAKRCLFMATTWDKDGNNIEAIDAWYEPNFDLRARIIAGWEQFEKDVAAYVPDEVIDIPQADAIKSLPAVVIQVSGTLTNCNLDDVTPKFDTFLAKAEDGKSTIDIPNGTAIAKFSREAAADCKLTAKAVVSQMASVSDAVNTLELYAKKFDAMGLAYEKEVDRLKEIEKVAALNKAKSEYASHITGLQEEILPIKLIVPDVDFASAIKGLKTVESKNNALNVALANGKISSDAIAKDIRERMAWFNVSAKGYEFLFPDLQQLIYI